MNRTRRKLIFSVIALLVISLSSFTLLSFTLADEENSALSESGKVLAADNSGLAPDATNIDRIIDNSINETYGDKNYYIVEFTSGAASSLEKMVSNGIFQHLVIDGHRTIEDVMADGCIKYTSYQVTNDMNDEDVNNLVKAVEKADFIYVHNDPNQMFGSAPNIDLPEALKIALSSAATGDFKPFVIDSYTKTKQISDNSAQTYNSLIKNNFTGTMPCYSWKDGLDMNSFMSRSTADSTFIPIHGKNAQKSVWQAIPTTDTGKKYYVAKVLTIKKGSDTTMTNAMMGGINLTPITIPDDVDPEYKAGGKKAWDTTNTYEFTDTADMYELAYFSREAQPDYIRFDVAEYDNLSGFDLSSYDYIVLEKGLNNANISTIESQDDYNSLLAAAYGKVHFIYHSSLAGKADADSLSENPAVSYAYVLDKVATPTDDPRFGNVLVTSEAKMAVYANATKSKTVKDIADIIINGSYRGIKSNSGGDSSTVYTVLEIEPSYPIDLVLEPLLTKAADFNDAVTGMSFKRNSYRQDYGRLNEPGFYYIRTSGVSSQTADEISYNNYDPISNGIDAGLITNANQANVIDYYNWTLSRAKIAHATGLKYNQVNVVHMSTYEFNTSRKSLLDNYDFIYIGGDNSGIKSASNWNNHNQYTMYFKDGDTMPSVGGSDGVLIGNDLTDIKYEELKDYASKMPVVVDSRASSAYDQGKLIDPSSNMYSLLGAVKSSAFGLWGFQSDKVVKIANVDEEYGKTYGGLVTVFGGIEEFDYLGNQLTDKLAPKDSDVDEADLKNLVTSKARPKIVLTKTPKLYVEGDSSSWITKDDFKFDYEVSTGKSTSDSDIEVRFFVDDDANSRFTYIADALDGSGDPNGKGPNEIRQKQNGKKGSIKWEFDDPSYFGPVYWKIEAKDKKTGAKVSVAGLSKIKRTDQKKMKVKLLQVLPDIAFNEQSKNTLYLCYECQQSRGILHANRSIANLTKYETAAVFPSSNGFKDNDTGICYKLTNDHAVIDMIEKYDADFDTFVGEQPFKASYQHTYMDSSNPWWVHEVTETRHNINNLGMHEHKFGIVKYYDSEKVYNKDNESTVEAQGVDNWNENWFNDVMRDYEVDVTIMTTREFEEMCKNIESLYKNKDAKEIESERQKYQDKADDYELYYECMQAVINGEYDSIDSGDKSKFVTFMKDKMKLATTETAINAKLATYTQAGPKLRKFLADNGDTLAKHSKCGGTEEQAKNEFKFERSDQFTYSQNNFYDFFSMFSDQNVGSYINDYADLYIPWRDAKEFEQYFKYKYKEYAKKAAVFYKDVKENGVEVENPDIGKCDLSSMFTCIALGASDDFNGDDINELGCDTLLNYVKQDGLLFLFHDTLVNPDANVSGNNATKTMTQKLSGAFGQLGPAKVTTRTQLFGSEGNWHNNHYKSMNKYAMYMKQIESNQQTLHGAHDVRQYIKQQGGGFVGTDKATQTNTGIITQYPFNIGSRLQISPTASQGYASNTADPNMTVYYALAGGTDGSVSSMYAADPNDGINNYFLYQYNSVVYTGAGHSVITGWGRQNNDERRLFINIILNSARKSTVGPTLNLYDIDSTKDDLKNKKVQPAPDANSETSADEEEAAEYVMYISDITELPEFSFVPTMGSDADVAKVEIWYDVDHSAGQKNVYTPGKDVYIYKQPPTKDAEKTFDYAGNNLGSGVLKKITSDTGPERLEGYNSYVVTPPDGSSYTVVTTKLELQQSYFGGSKNAAYIVVKVTDTNGKEIHRTMRIEFKPDLLELN